VRSLAPVALRQPRAPWRIGLAAPSRLVHLPRLAAWGDRAAGAALVITALVSWWSTRRHSSPTSSRAWAAG
jgi:hypothetical protein